MGDSDRSDRFVEHGKEEIGVGLGDVYGGREADGLAPESALAEQEAEFTGVLDGLRTTFLVRFFRGARCARSLAGETTLAAMLVASVDPERVKESGVDLKHAAACLELHIEQGPVLLDLELPLGAVLGTFGVERHAITFHGQAAHSGSTPMKRRKDAFLAAGKMGQEVYPITDRNGGVSTTGSCTIRPGIVTRVVEECRITLDQRHLEAAALTRDARGGQGRE